MARTEGTVRVQAALEAQAAWIARCRALTPR